MLQCIGAHVAPVSPMGLAVEGGGDSSVTYQCPEVSGSMWEVVEFPTASLGGRLTQPITSTPTWVPAGMNSAVTP